MKRAPWLEESELEALTKKKRPSSQAQELARAGIPFNMIAGRPVVMLQDLSPVRQFNQDRPRPKKL